MVLWSSNTPRDGKCDCYMKTSIMGINQCKTTDRAVTPNVKSMKKRIIGVFMYKKKHRIIINWIIIT